MKVGLSDEALEFGAVAAAALGAAGGDELAAVAWREPAVAARAVAVLGDLGAWDLAPSGSADELEAAAALCHAVGTWALPYPVAERLSRPAGAAVDGLSIVAGRRPVAAIAGIEGPWAASTLDGRAFLARLRAGSEGSRLGPQVCELDFSEPLDGAVVDVALAITLPCWTLLGMLERTIRLTVEHVQGRHQFGEPLASFQSVQFQLTEAEVQRTAAAQLAAYALWSVQTQRTDALLDALAARLSVLEAADHVFRICHQLHGAIGFCDETPISWISRHSQALRRLPLTLPATEATLAERAGRFGISGLFDDLGR